MRLPTKQLFRKQFSENFIKGDGEVVEIRTGNIFYRPHHSSCEKTEKGKEENTPTCEFAAVVVVAGVAAM